MHFSLWCRSFSFDSPIIAVTPQGIMNLFSNFGSFAEADTDALAEPDFN